MPLTDDTAAAAAAAVVIVADVVVVVPDDLVVVPDALVVVAGISFPNRCVCVCVLFCRFIFTTSYFESVLQYARFCARYQKQRL
jgi:hypothetical protein